MRSATNTLAKEVATERRGKLVAFVISHMISSGGSTPARGGIWTVKVIRLQRRTFTLQALLLPRHIKSDEPGKNDTGFRRVKGALNRNYLNPVALLVVSARQRLHIRSLLPSTQ